MEANVLFVQQLLFGLPCTSSAKEAEEAISDEDTDLGMLTDTHYVTLKWLRLTVQVTFPVHHRRNSTVAHLVSFKRCEEKCIIKFIKNILPKFG